MQSLAHNTTSRASIVQTDEIFDFEVVEEDGGSMLEDTCSYLRAWGSYIKDRLWKQTVDSRVEFTEHYPYLFRQVRLASNFDDELYR